MSNKDKIKKTEETEEVEETEETEEVEETEEDEQPPKKGEPKPGLDKRPDLFSVLVANMQNRINFWESRVSENQAGMGSVDRALNAERSVFVKQLREIQNQIQATIKDGE